MSLLDKAKEKEKKTSATSKILFGKEDDDLLELVTAMFREHISSKQFLHALGVEYIKKQSTIQVYTLLVKIMKKILSKNDILIVK